MLTVWCFLFVAMNKVEAKMDIQPVKCNMEILTKQQLNQGVYAKFSLTNLLEEDIELLTWYTPFEGFLSDLFIITDSQDEKLVYQGVMVKRGTPEPSDYLVLKPKETVSINIKLSDAYIFTNSTYTKNTFSVELKPAQFTYRYVKPTKNQSLNFSCKLPATIVEVQ
jgi:hypothetical protein